MKAANDVISRFIMEYSGQIKQLTWVPSSNNWILFWSQPRAQCEVYGFCGAFGSCNENSLPFCGCIKGIRELPPEDWGLGDQTLGCVRNTALQCNENSSAGREKDKFYTMDGDEEMSRPPMGQVLQMLEGMMEISMPPIQTSLQIYSGQHKQVLFFLDLSFDQNDHAQSTSCSSSQVRSSSSIISKENA
ncbi:hypothetical protein HPP92_013655 [Vanilla planifolia]|uniref:S-locus glycoprotein domain-containing protein n=1 Tax=Vanilla planifolia TaxID=51239 RepID=A0A835QXE2_VANPL|nr:hypothetical protein HPP92_013655 [Vanilla planifolia]